MYCKKNFLNISTYIYYYLILFVSLSCVYGSESVKNSFEKKSRVKRNAISYRNDINFYLFTQNNAWYPQKLIIAKNYDNFNETNLNPSNPTKIIVHGYNSGRNLNVLVDIRDNYLSISDLNVIAVDWENLSGGSYLTAIANSRIVGVYLARMIVHLQMQGFKDIHAIGFSLGAHVPAMAANYLGKYKISRITGLDPAGPFFTFVGPDAVLDAGDAEFVDVFHTNAKIQGMYRRSGHVDFYFNRGTSQPGCKDMDFNCYHSRAASYFAESIISTEGFWAHPCDLDDLSSYKSGKCSSSQPMILAGEYVDKNSTGSYSVVTNAQSPFAKGHH